MADRCKFLWHEKSRKQAHATPNIIANSTASPDTYKVPVTAGRRPYCGAALTGRHSDDGRNILIPTSLNAGILSIKICISIIPISAATTKASYISRLYKMYLLIFCTYKVLSCILWLKKRMYLYDTPFFIFFYFIGMNPISSTVFCPVSPRITSRNAC